MDNAAASANSFFVQGREADAAAFLLFHFGRKRRRKIHTKLPFTGKNAELLGFKGETDGRVLTIRADKW